MTAIRKFLELTATEKICFLRALSLLTTLKLHLALMSVETVCRKTFNSSEKLRGRRRCHTLPMTKISSLLGIASRIVPFSTCLSISLAGAILFAEYGYMARLHIGACRENGEIFKAHAWLTVNGTVVAGDLPGLEIFREFDLSAFMKQEKNNP
jgi:hypothetical protein